MLINFFHRETKNKPKGFSTFFEGHVPSRNNISHLFHFLYALTFALICILGGFAEFGYFYLYQDQVKNRVPTPKNINVSMLGFWKSIDFYY